MQICSCVNLIGGCYSHLRIPTVTCIFVFAIIRSFWCCAIVSWNYSFFNKENPNSIL